MYSTDLSAKPEITAFFDDDSNTISYVVKDQNSSLLCWTDYTTRR